MDMTEATDELRKSWGWFLAFGIVMAIGGLLALYAPFAASLAVEAIVGAAFLVGGIVILVQVFTTKDGWGARGTYLILGVFNLVAGIVLLLNPLQGLMALTLMMAIAILGGGAIRMLFGIQARPEKGWGWITASGVLSILFGIYIFMQFQEMSAILLGIFAGVSLIGDGASYIRFAYALKTGQDIDPVPPQATG